MTSNCALAETCARHEDDAGKPLLYRTCADVSEERIRRPGNPATCPFFIGKNDAQQTAH